VGVVEIHLPLGSVSSSLSLSVSILPTVDLLQLLFILFPDTVSLLSLWTTKSKSVPFYLLSFC
jgi:hypothetical protein